MAVEVAFGQVDVVTAGTQGPEGPQGPAGAGGASSFSKTAGGSITIYKMLAVQNTGDVVHADKDTASDEDRLVGIALGNATIGNPVNVQNTGEVTNALWAWSVGAPIYLGVNGSLTQTKPTSGFVLRIGLPSGTDRMVLDIDDLPEQATDSIAGIIEIATQVEVDAGADTERAITPNLLANTVLDGGSF